MLMEKKKKNLVLLEDKESNLLQIWTAASSPDVKSNKTIKKKFVFLANWLVFPYKVKYVEICVGVDKNTHYCMCLAIKV